MFERRHFLRSIPVAGTTAAIAGVALHASPASAAAGTSGFSILVAASNSPQSMQDVADYICTGSNDQNTINEAINSQSNIGGVVALSPGSFNCSGAVKVRSRVALVGSGRASVLRASNAWSGAMIEAYSTSTDKVTISDLALDGEYKNVNGILLNVTRKDDFEDGSPDAANYITDVYVHGVQGNGVHITGRHNRGFCVTRVRVWDAGGHGFVFNSPDGFVHQCESGSSGLDGFRVSSANSRFTNCKAWYADGSGFHIAAVRNEFSACEAQDNEQHGFYIASGQVSLTSCHADSNSWNRNQPVAQYSGFYIIRDRNRVQLIGCQAYDKNEGGRGNWQRWGFVLAGRNSQCQITGIGRDHVDGALFEGDNVIDNSIDVLGN